jgi:hypothetical protein
MLAGWPECLLADILVTSVFAGERQCRFRRGDVTTPDGRQLYPSVAATRPALDTDHFGITLEHPVWCTLRCNFPADGDNAFDDTTTPFRTCSI